MSYKDYKIGQNIWGDMDPDDFYGILQGLMRLADTDNLEKLKREWPEVWTELEERYNSPSGILPSDRIRERRGAV